MTNTFSGALRATLQFGTPRQVAGFASLALGCGLFSAGAAAGSYPLGYLGAVLALGALCFAKA